MNENIHKAQSYNLDHRDIGPKQNIFFFSEYGPGLPFYGPKGVYIKNRLIEYWREMHLKADYHEIESPMMLDRILWEKSGHWNLYHEHMYVSESDKRDFAIKPMNCPGAMLYYQFKKRSEVELPLRVCELGRVHRHEDSGALNGLLRSRSFIVDDGHIFCCEKDIESEVIKILKMSQALLKKLGFNKFSLELSVRSESNKDKYLGSEGNWKKAEQALEHAANISGINYKRMEGEAKFYGPALDLLIEDRQNKKWQCSSVQLDFNLPSRFDLKYYDKQGKKQVPVLIHRCLFGSLERFLGVMLDHYQGHLPIWLLPEQLRILPIDAQFNSAAKQLWQDLQDSGIKVSIDESNSNLSQKIKRAAQDYIPYKLIFGEYELKNQMYALRGGKCAKKSYSKKDIINLIKN